MTADSSVYAKNMATRLGKRLASSVARAESAQEWRFASMPGSSVPCYEPFHQADLARSDARAEVDLLLDIPKATYDA